jgi:hypothetical protein
MKYTMSDGRVFTSYLPNCELNRALQQNYGTNDVHSYRYYLQQNAEKVMQDTKIGTDDCKFCPVCEASLAYRPKGDILVEQAKK